jgi:ornithine carbamoyltransferase
MKTNFKGRNLITFEKWTKAEIEEVLRASYDFKKKFHRGDITEYLKHKTLFMIFFEQSTRTRNSLEAAMTQLGGHAHDLTLDKMQLSHGESPRDTAKVLSRMGEGISVRNCFYGTGNSYINEIAGHSDIPVISMQDDVYHPLQAIADLMTIEECYGKNLRGLKVAVSWAYATSHAKPLSVPQSQMLLFPRFGIDVTVAHPVEFPLQKDIVKRAKKNAAAADTSLTFVNDMDEGIRGADIVIPKNWGGFAGFDTYNDSEHQKKKMKEYLQRHTDWICNKRRFSLAKKDAKVMHALPADRGKEVTNEVLDSESSIIYDEAENRLHTSKAILALVMGSNGKLRG